MTPPAPQLPERILVVEDEEASRRLLTHAFERFSTIFSTDNGEEALEILRRERPDFVLTDLMLPGMDGMEVMRRARRTFYGACVPFIVLTANQDEDALIRCFEAGADDFMVKPARMAELRIRVSSLYLRTRTVRDVNPLTRLPGNVVLKSEMDLRLGEQRSFTVLYADLDHFKAFNDDQGFDAGDEVILTVADCMTSLADEREYGDVFVGHVGGDDFVVLVDDDRAETYGQALLDRFEREKARFYSKEQLAEGSVLVETRSGEKKRVPLLSLSIGGVTTSRPGVDDVRHLTHLAAEVKHAAKARPGNALVIDRRRWPLGSPG